MLNEPRQPERKNLGPATALIKNHLDLSGYGLSWGHSIDYGTGQKYPVSQMVREGTKLEVSINLPGLFLASAAWEHRYDAAGDLDSQCRIAFEILSAVHNQDHHFIELSYIPTDQKEFERNIDLTCALSVVQPVEDKKYLGHLSVRYLVSERQLDQAAPRIARSLGNIVDFCLFQGTQRAIEAMVDRALQDGGPLGFTAVVVPVSERLSPTDILEKSLPTMIRPSELSKGGVIGPDRKLVQYSEDRIVLRIPCLKIPSEKLHFMLNETRFAKDNDIIASFVDLPWQQSPVKDLVDDLAANFSTIDSPPTKPTVPQRKEPGYWRIEIPFAKGDIRSGLRTAVQYLATFREVLYRARFHQEDGSGS